MRLQHRTTLFTALLFCCVGSSAEAALIGNPLLEEFDASAQNWRVAVSANTATWVSGGGPDGAGDAFIRSTFTTPGSSPQVVLRARLSEPASDGIFFGDWTGGQKVINFSVRHNAPTPLTFGLRFPMPANFPAMNGTFSDAVDPNEWTQLTLVVNESNPLWINEGAVFNDVFSNVTNIQLYANLGSLPAATTIDVDLDNFQVVPEPSTIAIAAMGLPAMVLAGVRYRRRKYAEKSAA